jgi:hypothetical protein
MFDAQTCMLGYSPSLTTSQASVQTLTTWLVVPVAIKGAWVCATRADKPPCNA